MNWAPLVLSLEVATLSMLALVTTVVLMLYLANRFLRRINHRD